MGVKHRTTRRLHLAAVVVLGLALGVGGAAAATSSDPDRPAVTTAGVCFLSRPGSDAAFGYTSTTSVRYNLGLSGTSVINKHADRWRLSCVAHRPGVGPDDFVDFEAFFPAHRRALGRTAYFLTGDDDAAEELLQSAFAKVAAKWDRIAPTASPRAYVRQAMLNEVRSRWRRRSRIAEYAVAELPEDRAGVDVATEVADREVLGNALRRLTKGQRAVLYLRFYEDLSESETARALGCSLGTAGSHVVLPGAGPLG